MAGLPWFRVYVEFLNDPKMVAISFENQRHFIGLLALKGDGTIDQDCSAEIMDKIVAQRLWVDFSVIKEVKEKLMEAELIDEFWQPVSWEKRQKNSDHDPSGATRQKRFRDKKNKKAVDVSTCKIDGKNTVTLCNGENNALSNGSVTLPDKIRGDKIREDNNHDGDAFFKMDELLAMSVKYLGWNPVLSKGQSESMRPLVNIFKEDVAKGFKVASENNAKSINYVIKVTQGLVDADSKINEFEDMFGSR